MPSPEIETRTHWREASTLTTVLFLFPQIVWVMFYNIITSHSKSSSFSSVMQILFSEKYTLSSPSEQGLPLKSEKDIKIFLIMPEIKL